jgi:hypothetical protein
MNPAAPLRKLNNCILSLIKLIALSSMSQISMPQKSRPLMRLLSETPRAAFDNEDRARNSPRTRLLTTAVPFRRNFRKRNVWRQIERAGGFPVGVKNPARSVKSDTCFAHLHERRASGQS